MKHIVFARHGDNKLGDSKEFGMWQPESPLTPEGKESARLMRKHLGGDLKILRHSPFKRAEETAKILVPDGDWSSAEALAPTLEKWEDMLSEGREAPKSIEEVDKLRPGLIDQEMQSIFELVNKILQSLKDGEQALLVSHQPFAGFIRHKFEGDFDPYSLKIGLPKGGMYHFSFDENNKFVETKTFLP